MAQDDKEEGAKKGITDFPKYRKNPFVERMLYMAKTRNKIVGFGPILGVHDAETGAIKEDSHMRQALFERVDREDFVKIFTASAVLALDLSQSGQALFGYIISKLGYNDDRVFLDPLEVMEGTGYKSRATVTSMIRELVEKELIARSNNSALYFINLRVFFKGDRLDIIKSYVVKDTPADVEMQRQLAITEARASQLNLNFEE